MERWVIVSFMAILALGLVGMSWRYRRQIPAAAMLCATIEEHCQERPLLAP